MALHDYMRKDYAFAYLKTKDGAEVDLIVERPGMPLALIEIKSTNRIDTGELNTLKNFVKDFKNALVSTPRIFSEEKMHQPLFRSKMISPYNTGINPRFKL